MFVGRIREQATHSRDVPSTSSAAERQRPSSRGASPSCQDEHSERTERPISRGRGRQSSLLPSLSVGPPMDALSDAGRRSSPQIRTVQKGNSPQSANLARQSSFRQTMSSAPAPTKFSRVRREPSTRATPAQLRAIFDVPHEPLPLLTVAGGGAFGTVYLVETSTGRIAVKQVCDAGGPSAGGRATRP